MNYKKAATAVSWIFHPFFMPTYMILMLLSMTVLSLYATPLKLYLLWVVALYSLIIPGLMLFVLRPLGFISSYRIDNRKERYIPLLIGMACYVLCALTFAKIPAMMFLRKFMFGAAACELLCLVVSLRWKISLHMTAMGAAVAVLLLLNYFGTPAMIPLVLTTLAAGALASSRLYLGCHTPAQIAAGFGGGALMMLFAFLFF